MSTVSGVSSMNTNTGSTGSSSGMSSLGINDFLTLMTTQLKYQDPTKPQDSSAFVAQLAQFSTVSGIQEMNTSLSSLLDAYKSSQTTNATSFVGHNVLVNASSATISAGGTLSGAVDTPTNTSAVTLQISDSSGAVVREFSVTPNAGGLTSFTWDGKNTDGSTASAGTYSVKAIANVNGTTAAETTYLNGKVGSVTIDSSSNSVVLNTDELGSVGITDVKQIS
jgi:flagellar basal-body rod modification protein FlgD